MAETRKPYISPGIESERLSPPEAWACEVYGANTSVLSWSGDQAEFDVMVTNYTYVC